MHSRRLITFLLGAWLGGMALVAMIAVLNLRTADHILDMPLGGAKVVLDKLGSDARPLIRHEVAEINRTLFESWEWIQVTLGGLLLAVVIFSRRHSKDRVLLTLGIIGSMLVIVLVQRLLLTPEMIGTGRLIDFGKGPDIDRERRVFGSLHAMYGVAEVVKGLVGVFYLGLLLRSKGRPSRSISSSRRSGNIDAIDEADYSHVDG